MHLHYLNHLHQLFLNLLYFNDFDCFVSFRNCFFNIFDHFDNFLLNDGYFNLSLNLFDNLSDQRHNFLYGLFYLLDPVLVNYLFFNNLYLLYSGYFHPYFHNLLYNLRHFFDPLNYLDYWDYFFDYPLYDLRHLLNVIHNLLGSFIVHCVDQFLYDLFNLNNHWFLYYSLHYLLHNDLHFFYFFDCFLHHNSLLLDHLHLSDLGHSLIHHSLDDDWLFYLYNFFLDDLNFNYFGYLDPLLHYFLYDFGNFYNFLFDLIDLYYFLDDLIDILDDFHWHMNHLLYFLYLCLVYNLLNNFLHWHNYGHFNHSLHYFLNNLGHLHYFVVDLEYLQNVVDGHIIYLFMDHSDN